MNKKDLIECIKLAYNEAKLEEANEEKYGTPDYVENFDPYTEISITGDEVQYCVEFGWMMAREGMPLIESEYDEYLEQILSDCCSVYKLKDLV
mgnify:FL=1